MVWKSRLDTLALLLVHGMQSMRLQHHISKAAILLRPGLFEVQVTEAYKAIGKNKSLDKPDFGCSKRLL